METPDLVFTVANEVATILELPPEQLQPATELAGFDLWDSLAAAMFAAAMAERFGCELENAEIAGAPTVEALTRLVQRKTGEAR
jgi:acyl carrier protein